MAVCTELWLVVVWPHNVTVCEVMHVASAADRRMLRNRSRWRSSKWKIVGSFSSCSLAALSTLVLSATISVEPTTWVICSIALESQWRRHCWPCPCACSPKRLHCSRSDRHGDVSRSATSRMREKRRAELVVYRRFHRDGRGKNKRAQCCE